MLRPNKLLLTVGLLFGAVVVFAMGGSPNNKLAEYMINIVSKGLGKNLTKVQKDSIVAICASWGKYGDGDARKLIYILALAWHESRLQPIKEIKAKPGTYVWDTYQVKYWNTGFYGRGFVQLTWEANYQKMGKVLGVNLVANPDLALKPQYAADIIVYGMMNGSFTGKKLGDFINSEKADYYNARDTVGAKIVAGSDTAALIVGYAENISAQIL